MSASISHEIKNVLAIINENAGLLKDIVYMAEKRPMSPERLDRLAGTLIKQVDRADGIVKNMNRFSHGVDNFVGPVDLNETLTFVAALGARLMDMRGCTIEISPAGPDATLVTSRFLLENLVWRCLDFATSALPENKNIRLAADKTETGPRIRILGLDGLEKISPDEFPGEGEKALLEALNVDLTIDAANRVIILRSSEF
ncbi:MAG: hypothetical protein GY859_19745 [Desulfobacterales bacterium]|nr:hypothetical protein [Desulfobacterales bacterium]